MKLNVFFTPAELAGHSGAGAFVVLDVIRATSTIVTALEHGARSVFPVRTADDAARLAQNLGRDAVILCGERKGLPIEGFDLGNSPLEFTDDIVADKALVMTTTNGTNALLAAAELPGPKAADDATAQDRERQRRVLVGSFLNLGAVAAAVAGEAQVTVVCAGKEGRFALEDAVCAGALIQRIEESSDGSAELNDSGDAAVALAKRFTRSVPALLKRTAAGQAIAEIGLADDLAFVAQIDCYQGVPVFDDRKITLPPT